MNYISMVVTLLNRLFVDEIIGKTENIVLVASRRNTSKHLNTLFSESVTSRTNGIKVDIEIVKPSDDKCLQAVDFVP